MGWLTIYLYACGYVLTVFAVHHTHPHEPAWKSYVGSIFWPVIIPIVLITDR